jgi:alpha-tubulin suppressor-like RCC1 family protein
VWGWGKNQSGQMGLPPGTGQDCPFVTGNVCKPIQIGAGNLIDVKAIDAGTYFNLVIRDDGSVSTWGAGGSGQLGRGTVPSDQFPGPVVGVDGAISVVGGGDHALALKADGTVMSWGRNGECELGTANCCMPPVTRCNMPIPQPNQPFPQQVAGQNGAGILFNITAIGTTLYHTSYALDGHGRVYAWGENLNGQLGDGNFGPFWVGSFPDWVHAPGGGGQLMDLVAITGGGSHGLGLGANGKLDRLDPTDAGEPDLHVRNHRPTGRRPARARGDPPGRLDALRDGP